MDDLFQEIEALVDQGFEGLLDIVRVIEGREPREPEFRVNQPENVDRSSPTDERQSFFSENTVLSTPSSEESVQPTLAGVGGLSSVLRELRELVELPLKRPNVLAALGLEPTTGVLLTGPPGTGKTLTARALATDLDVNYIAIVGPEVIGKYYGEAESRLRSIFQKAARSAPCIIFIDEIDSLAPDRSKVEGEVEKRVVAQLLSLMDGFAKTKGIIVLAATNRPDHLDPALRRPGRFDREIAFRVPDRGGRLEILEILTAMMPLHESVDLNAIADLSGGMVGADLKALSQKAAYLALRRLLPSLDSPMPAQMSVTQVDFLEAIRHIKPAVLRSIEIEAPKVTWDAIGGLDHIKQTLQDSVEGALLYPELYDHTKAKAPRGILLWGEPGTGKTLLAKAVAAQARANFIAVNGPELLSKWVGASEQAVRELFTKARQASPCVVFVDEIDTLAPARGRYQSDSGVSDRVVGQLLTELDGLHDCTNVLFVGATNRPETLDPALLRAGRLDLQLKVDLPDHMSRLAILHVHNRDRPLEEVELDSFAAQTEGWNGADLALLSNQAALEAVRRYRTQGMNDPTCLRITMDDFTIAYQRLLLQREMAR
ncbi:AAA ATPase [Leptolyngbya boryana NIES-2135]|jgi:transitional endoplasmic reticulum ATPase|uniref:AAA ATPase n=1 Tax=Leptolyngbya boryana NIES-2135 TaxID=1973484 RepID=A0A1Z4JN77_LEPBY|nr:MULTISPECIES: AAA family ATPase [Leptolyngbya]ULP29250.1 AAA family ATPase [Leptolyngbya boryana IU 594]BAS55683.1 ATPase AAA [Leptolyngbya boryana IAM M-101]BAS62031.1 ATPase AAA [Leptolyngbya boryana dg5]BAY58160.1 AAA ATPase [Leptolyngbya boryana NIES-2135]